MWNRQGRRAVSCFEDSSGRQLRSKSGFTPQDNFYLLFGWREQGERRSFASSVLTEMNAATNGVIMYCSKPGRKLILGRLEDRKVLEHYLGL